jgi:putative endonuclease
LIRSYGAEAEALAAEYLRRQGLAIIERNYRCRFGEIDIIARDGATLVFVEVRMRTSSAYGGAAASITAAKRAKLMRAARSYLAARGRTPACRFDAILVTGMTRTIEWLKDAFRE